MFETVEVIERQKKFDELLKKKYGKIIQEEFIDKVEINRTIARNYYYGGNVTMKTLDKVANNRFTVKGRVILMGIKYSIEGVRWTEKNFVKSSRMNYIGYLYNKRILIETFTNKI